MNLPQLVTQHKDTLDRLYKAWDKAITNQAHDIAFKALDDYLEHHNLSLETVSLIRDYGKPEVDVKDCFDLA